MFKQNKFLLLSFFAHLIIIYIVAQSVTFPPVPDSAPQEPDLIQATLIFDLPVAPVATPIEETPVRPAQPSESTSPPIGSETSADDPVEVITEPSTQEPPESLPPELAIETDQEDLDKTSEVIDSVSNEQPARPAVTQERGVSATSMARRHLSQFQQQQRNRVAEQAARNYQQYKNSPIINDEVKNPFMTEDEKVRDSLKIRADCSSTGKQTAAVLLGFLGGQIDCSKPPPISGFIQDRLNKQAHLPGQPIEDEPSRPKSLVIKD